MLFEDNGQGHIQGQYSAASQTHAERVMSFAPCATERPFTLMVEIFTGPYFDRSAYFPEPYMIAFSRSQNKKYFFNTMTREAVYHTPKETIATFK